MALFSGPWKFGRPFHPRLGYFFYLVNFVALVVLKTSFDFALTLASDLILKEFYADPAIELRRGSNPCHRHPESLKFPRSLLPPGQNAAKPVRKLFHLSQKIELLCHLRWSNFLSTRHNSSFWFCSQMATTWPSFSNSNREFRCSDENEADLCQQTFWVADLFSLEHRKNRRNYFLTKIWRSYFFRAKKNFSQLFAKKMRFVAKLVLKRILAKVLGPGQKIGPFILGLKNRIASSCHVSSLPLDLPNLVDTFSKSSEISCAGILIRPKLFSWRVGRASLWCQLIFSLWR